MSKKQLTSQPLTNPEALVRRYASVGVPPSFGYATVADFCDSAEHLPQITGLNGDLKNVQRPWAVKALLRCVPPPARLLEIGGGEPLVCGFLSELGYDVTLVDPYDGFGNGPTDYERYRTEYPNVNIVRGYLRPGMTELGQQRFDGVFSVSVLEHLTPDLADTCFEAIREFLQPGGWSVHCFDFILQGVGEAHDPPNARRILAGQSQLAGALPVDFDGLILQLREDVETFFLSPQGHHQWRGGKTYPEFPFRKVVSLQTIARRAT